MAKSFIISIFLHLVLLNIFYSENIIINKKKHIIQFVEIRKTIKNQTTKTKNTKQTLKLNSSKGGVRGKFNHIKLSDLAPSGFSIGENKMGLKTSENGIGKFGDNTLKQQNENLGTIINKVFDKIESHLNYPKILLSKEIQGIVNARVVINPNGTLNEKKSKFYSNSNFLKVHTVRILRKSLTRIDHNNLSALTIDCVFNFEISTRKIDRNENRASNSTFFFTIHHFGGSRPSDIISQAALLAATTVLQGINVIQLLSLAYENAPSELKLDKDSVAYIIEQHKFERYKSDPAWEY